MSVEPSFLQLAVDHGVRRVVPLSSQGIGAMGMAAAGRRADRGRRRGGRDHPGGGLVPPEAGGLVLALGEVRQGLVDAGDVAAVAVAALTGDGHAGGSFALTGPRARSLAQAVELIGRASGRWVRVRGADAGDLAQQAALGAPGGQARQGVKALAALGALGDAQPTGVVRRVTGREPKGFATVAAEAAARGAWRG